MIPHETLGPQASKLLLSCFTEIQPDPANHWRMRRCVLLALGALFWTVLGIAHVVNDAATVGQALDDMAARNSEQPARDL